MTDAEKHAEANKRYRAGIKEMQKTLREMEQESGRLRDKVRTLESQVRQFEGKSEPVSPSREVAFLAQLEGLRSVTGHAAVAIAARDLLAQLGATVMVRYRWRRALMRFAGVRHTELAEKGITLSKALDRMGRA